MENLDNTTHRVVMTIGSINANDEVGISIKLDPEITGADIEALGYKPPCLEFLDRFVLPMLEEVFMKSNHPELFDPDASPTVQ